jgi:hypothetical protein
MEALLKALAEALGPYLPTGGAVETSSDLSPQTIEAVHAAVGEFITGGGIESEIESAVTDEVEAQITNNDLISQTDIETLIEDAETGEGITEDGLLEAVRNALNMVV